MNGSRRNDRRGPPWTKGIALCIEWRGPVLLAGWSVSTTCTMSRTNREGPQVEHLQPLQATEGHFRELRPLWGNPRPL